MTRTGFALLNVQERVFQAFCRVVDAPMTPSRMSASPSRMSAYLEYCRLVRLLVRLFDQVTEERFRHRLN